MVANRQIARANHRCTLMTVAHACTAALEPESANAATHYINQMHAIARNYLHISSARLGFKEKPTAKLP